jgi:hypothetical protein
MMVLIMNFTIPDYVIVYLFLQISSRMTRLQGAGVRFVSQSDSGGLQILAELISRKTRPLQDSDSCRILSRNKTWKRKMLAISCPDLQLAVTHGRDVRVSSNLNYRGSFP